MNTPQSRYYEDIGDSLYETGRLNEAERAYRRAQNALNMQCGLRDFSRIQEKIMAALGAA